MLLTVTLLVSLCQVVRMAFKQYSSEYICNALGAFSFSLSASALVFLACGILFLFGVQWWKEEHKLFSWPYALLFSGGLSNLSERVWYGCVTDYAFLPLVSAGPLFNLADVFLTFGAVGIVWKLSQKG